MEYFEVINLEKYQSDLAKDKPWIKWWKRCLLSVDGFLQLSDSQRWIFIGVVLLAVDMHNKVPYDPLWVSEKVCYKTRKRSTNCQLALLKMLEIPLIRMKNSDIREDKIREEKRISSSKKLKPTFKGQEMRKQGGRWWVIPKSGGKWLEFALKEKDIEWV